MTSNFKKNIEEATALYEQGWSLSQIGKKYNRTRQAVGHCFKLCGVPLRPRGGNNNPTGIQGERR